MEIKSRLLWTTFYSLHFFDGWIIAPSHLPLSHDDANSPKKNKLRSLRRSPYSTRGTQNRRRPGFRSLHHILCDVGRPGLARTSYIQVYKAATTSMVLDSSRTRDGRDEKTVHAGRSCWFAVSCFGENGLRMNEENRSRPDTTYILFSFKTYV